MLVDLPTRASDLAYQVCLEILSKLPGPITYSELMKMACEANAEVAKYIGQTFVSGENKRYRSVLERLKGHSRVAKKRRQSYRLRMDPRSLWRVGFRLRPK